MRLLHRWIQDLRILNLKMLALQGDRITSDGLAPYLKELLGYFIALIVREKNAVAERLVWIAARNHVNQQPSLGKPVKRRCHSRRSRRRSDAGANRHQKLELGCYRD